MANPTTNFGWVMPTATDLVTDLPADFNVFGQGVDTSMQYLLGGTTGQVLSKTSGTNMAFTWTTPQVGDITGVTAGTGISGGGTSGDVTVSINTAVTADLTTAQTMTNKTLTTPKISNYTTAGDIVYGTGSSVISRLGIGTVGQVLAVNSGATAPEWVSPGGGGLTFIKAQTIGTAVSTVTVTGAFSTTNDNYLITIIGGSASTNSTDINIKFGSATTGYKFVGYYMVTTSATMNTYANNAAGNIACGGGSANGMASNIYVMSPFLSARTAVISQTAMTHSDMYRQEYAGFLDDSTSYTSFIIAAAGTTLTGGTIRVYGYQKS